MHTDSVFSTLQREISNFPIPLFEIICEYANEERTWDVVQRPRSSICTRFFKSQKAEHDKALRSALIQADIPQAIQSIKSGATPIIDSELFLTLLEKNSLKSLNFILTQMNHLDTQNSLPKWYQKMVQIQPIHDPLKSLFHPLKWSVIKLEPPSFFKGLTLYLKHVPHLCDHEVNLWCTLNDEKKENTLSRPEIKKLCAQKIAENCNCPTPDTQQKPSPSIRGEWCYEPPQYVVVRGGAIRVTDGRMRQILA